MTASVNNDQVLCRDTDRSTAGAHGDRCRKEGWWTA
jgi:hypothetical protein